MKIDSDQIMSVVNRYKSDPVEKRDDSSRTKSKAAAPGGDRVELSINSGEIEHLKQTMQGLSDVRADRVASLKKVIDDGTYSRLTAGRLRKRCWTTGKRSMATNSLTDLMSVLAEKVQVLESMRYFLEEEERCIIELQPEQLEENTRQAEELMTRLNAAERPVQGASFPGGG